MMHDWVLGFGFALAGLLMFVARYRYLKSNEPLGTNARMRKVLGGPQEPRFRCVFDAEGRRESIVLEFPTLSPADVLQLRLKAEAAAQGVLYQWEDDMERERRTR